PSGRVREVGDPPVGLVHDLSSDRHAELHVGAVSAALAGAAPALAAGRPKETPAAEGREIAEIAVGDHDNRAPGPAVASIRPPARDVLLAPEAERTVAAPPGLDSNLRAIVEHGAAAYSRGQTPGRRAHGKTATPGSDPWTWPVEPWPVGAGEGLVRDG